MREAYLLRPSSLYLTPTEASGQQHTSGACALPFITWPTTEGREYPHNCHAVATTASCLNGSLVQRASEPELKRVQPTIVTHVTAPAPPYYTYIRSACVCACVRVTGGARPDQADTQQGISPQPHMIIERKYIAVCHALAPKRPGAADLSTDRRPREHNLTTLVLFRSPIIRSYFGHSL
jgi:hypothetical protein